MGSLGRVGVAEGMAGGSQREGAEESVEEDEPAEAAWEWTVWKGAAQMAHHHLMLLRACAEE